MRGRDSKQPSIFVHATVDSFVPESHPLRAVKELAELALVGLSQQIGRRYSRRARDFFDAIVERDMRPHIAIQHNRKQPLYDKRTTSSRGYQFTQIYRRKVEGTIGWFKHPGRMKRVRLRGLKRVNHLTYFVGAAHNLLRIVNLTRREARPTTS